MRYFALLSAFSESSLNIAICGPVLFQHPVEHLVEEKGTHC